MYDQSNHVLYFEYVLSSFQLEEMQNKVRAVFWSGKYSGGTIVHGYIHTRVWPRRPGLVPGYPGVYISPSKLTHYLVLLPAEADARVDSFVENSCIIACWAALTLLTHVTQPGPSKSDSSFKRTDRVYSPTR